MILLYTELSLIEECENKNYIFPLVKLLVNGNEELQKEYQICTEMHQAHVAIFPIAIEFYLKEHPNNKSKLQQFIDLAVSENKKILVFTSGDIGLTLQNENVYTLRLGGFASKIKEQGWIMPPFINDPYTCLETTPTYLTKSPKAQIGFVGQSNQSILKLLKEMLLFLRLNSKIILGKEQLDYQPFYPSGFFRHRFLSQLKTCNALDTDFIYRQQYRAGAKNESDKHKTTLEFYTNMHNNLYTFCMRGGGNFSVRLYETLAMGRIPVILNTNCKFPFEDHIDWQKNCIIVEEKDTEQLCQRIVEFHQNHSNDEITVIQQENRLIWQDYFTDTNFFLHFKKEILKII